MGASGVHEIDHRIYAIASAADDVVSRTDVLACGGSDNFVRQRLEEGVWQQLQRGVYLVGAAPPTWHQLVRAAVAASGLSALSSHRAALVLWGLDGLRSAPVEVQVVYRQGPAPTGAVVHRSRRIEPASSVRGIPVTGVERTLLGCGAVCGAVTVEKALASAIRKRLTTTTMLALYLEANGGKGRRGTRLLRELVAAYHGQDRAPGSPAEAEMLRLMRHAGIPDPVLQYELQLRDGTVAVIDLAWPALRKGIEIEGWEHHSSVAANDYDTWRYNLIRDAGFDLRRYSGRRVQRHPEQVAASVVRFLCGVVAA